MNPYFVLAGAGVDALDAQDGLATQAWFVPESPGQRGCYIFEQPGGPKAYLRVWLPSLDPEKWQAVATDWGWVIPDTAVRLWG